MLNSARLPGHRARLALLLAATCAASPSAQSAPDARTARMIADLGLREAPTPLRETPGWTAPRRVLVRDLTEERRVWLQAVAPGVELVGADSFEAARAAASQADAVLGFCEEPIIAAGSRVRWVQTYNAGVERCVGSKVFASRGIVLSNMQRIAGPVMAEHVMALLLAHARGLPGYVLAQRDGRWARGGAAAPRGLPSLPNGDLPAFTLVGKTMVVVGFGGVGSEVARRAHAFGIRVLAIRNSKADPPPFVERMGVQADLASFVREADIIVDTLPLTDETRGLFDGRIFGAVKRGAFFINVGRGATVDTGALVAALRDGRLGGAGLDVTDPEPLPPGHPLWSLPNVIITPHVSADSEVDEEVRWLLVRENLRRFAVGDRLLSVVDPARGY